MKLTRFLKPDVFVIALMCTLIAMLIVPMPLWLIDTLIAVNMVTAALVFASSFHITSILSFSSFPAILLITTVFRLALTITTSRMILMEADAGHIVSAFGTFVIGGDVLIGFTVFAIVTVVQFMVITKGAERVAEVCARFSLDGLPGKQMSIDADLRANVINGEQAREQRRRLERESQLYGALDGAVKFVKGDAIAGILVIFVNLIGGISMGMVRHGMGFDEALETYTLLTVGDGLVAQIPALLISVAAGFFVTRVNGDDENLSVTMVRQIFSNSHVFLTAAALALAAAFLPGFPSTIFVLLAGALAAGYVMRAGGVPTLRARLAGLPGMAAPGRARGADAQAAARAGSGAESGAGSGAGTDVANVVPETIALAVLLPPGRQAWADESRLAGYLARAVFLQLGVKVPDIEVRESSGVDAQRLIVLVNEIQAATVSIGYGARRVVAGTEALAAAGANVLDLSQQDDHSHWIDATIAHQLEATVTTRSDLEEVAERFCTVVARHITEFFGIQETKNLLDQLETKYPELVKETYRNAPVQRIANVLQRLVAERISIRNLKTVLEAIAQWAPRERDNIMLAEQVRSALGRYITERFSRGQHLNVLVLAPHHEENVRRAIQQTATGTYLSLAPADSKALLDDLSARLAGLQLPLSEVTLLAAPDIRRFVKRVIELPYPQLDVISYPEVTDQSRINILHTV
ncbi:EscV/YscV/HrcV family type III secretion system export apparatus protein [Burkholderia ambifaria]|uniref:EscV/YscV/HrcV family type III secretion system export apparatus protein n=1 Tax=Burkholderia ambifaria TaxID=152480 RepID=UPI0015902BFA|nr:EscV/YscV/HrcV family type III secretion system export apparatus protein [Burkholderia ambifaria]